jgi:uncharacterized membrane protein YbhN (UPF0104 family)
MRKHIGSTAAIVFGIIMFLAGANPANKGWLATGLVVIFGALAYRSAKKRKLSEVRQSVVRKGFELLALLMVAAETLLKNDLKNLIATDPIINFIIPVCVFIAYIVISIKKTEEREPMEVHK